MKCVQTAQTHGIGSKTIQPKHIAPNLQPLQYDYDLEKTAMQRAAEIAIIYSTYVQITKDTFSAFYENSVYYTYAGENIAAGYGTADGVNAPAGGEDNGLYAGQDWNEICLILNSTMSESGHVYYNGFHYWVENFAYRDKVNTTCNFEQHRNYPYRFQLQHQKFLILILLLTKIGILQNR